MTDGTAPQHPNQQFSTRKGYAVNTDHLPHGDALCESDQPTDGLRPQHNEHYVGTVLRERSRAVEVSLSLLVDLGWKGNEILAAVHTVCGLIRLPHVRRKEVADELLFEQAPRIKWCVDSCRWRRLAAQVRKSEEVTLALVLLRRELAADNMDWQQGLERK
jgi:hypothetical protein